MIGAVQAWLAANRVLAIGIACMAALTLCLWFISSIVDDIRTGGEAIGRAEASKEQQENADAETAARHRVRDCRLAGGLWDGRAGQCVPAAREGAGGRPHALGHGGSP